MTQPTLAGNTFIAITLHLATNITPKLDVNRKTKQLLFNTDLYPHPSKSLVHNHSQNAATLVIMRRTLLESYVDVAKRDQEY